MYRWAFTGLSSAHQIVSFGDVVRILLVCRVEARRCLRRPHFVSLELCFPARNFDGACDVNGNTFKQTQHVEFKNDRRRCQGFAEDLPRRCRRCRGNGVCQSDWPMSEYRSFFNLSFSLRANLGRENRNSLTPSSDASTRIHAVMWLVSPCAWRWS